MGSLSWLGTIAMATGRLKILVMEYVDGVKMNDTAAIASLGVDISSLLELLCLIYADTIFLLGSFNADPHPGNLHVRVKVSAGHAETIHSISLSFGYVESTRFASKVTCDAHVSVRL